MKLQRAERRETQEAQRKIDNEEVSDEEEAEMSEEEGQFGVESFWCSNLAHFNIQ